MRNVIQTELATAQTQVQEASNKLKETNKQLTAVSDFTSGRLAVVALL